MDELYRLHSSIPCSSNSSINVGFNECVQGHVDHNLARLQTAAETDEVSGGSEMSDLIKAQIANHPLYPTLQSAYVECRKVGAPPEMASLLEEISKESLPFTTRSEIGSNPELDEFMESFCEVMRKYKEEFTKSYDEATAFLNNIELQLSSLCQENLTATTTASPPLASGNYHSDEAGGTTDEDLSCGEAEAAEQDSAGARHSESELKDMLLHKYSGYLSSLRREFLKKRKKGKLPKDARVTLMDWWNTHYRWPYPTEEEKMKMSKATGLNAKQINNWFINQRKRHWRPSEDMRLSLMEDVSGIVAGSMYFDATGGTSSNTGT